LLSLSNRTGAENTEERRERREMRGMRKMREFCLPLLPLKRCFLGVRLAKQMTVFGMI
jgi:hypothetical protein